MSYFNSKIQICNLAAGGQGLKNSINNIDTPTSDKEIVFAQWYDITRQHVLKFLMPNFALQRVILAALPAVPAAYANDYQFAYPVPSNCLKVTTFNDQVSNGGPTLRFIADVTDVTLMSPDFIMTFASILGKMTAMVNTQDPGKKASLLKDAMQEWTNSTAQNAQENKPIRRSRSKFRESRYINRPSSTGKA